MLELDNAFSTEREKVRAAQTRYRLQSVTEPDDPLFETAYRMLEDFFGDKGELEEREALRTLLQTKDIYFGDGLFTRYRLVLAYDQEEVVAVRDCYTELDLSRRLSVIALSHSLIVPSHRRSGLAALLRSFPVGLAREMNREFFAEPLPILVTAEMEPVDPQSPETVIRLLAYGRAGFSVIDPRYVPYTQPDFRDLTGLGFSHWGMPLLSLVRWVGNEGVTELPLELATIFPRHYNAFHRRYTTNERVDLMVENALGTLQRQNVTRVPLLRLPTQWSELALLRPLLRGAVLPLYPPVLRGEHAGFGEVEQEYAALQLMVDSLRVGLR